MILLIALLRFSINLPGRFHFFLLRSDRRQNETGYSLETLCHDPALPLYGVMLDDYNSSDCEMKEKNTTQGPAHFCSCRGEECNDVIRFSSGEFRRNLPASQLQTAVTPPDFPCFPAAVVSVSFHAVTVYCQATVFWL